MCWRRKDVGGSTQRRLSSSSVMQWRGGHAHESRRPAVLHVIKEGANAVYWRPEQNKKHMKCLISIDRWKRVTFNPCKLFRDSIVICASLWILCFFRIIHIWFFDKARQPSKPKPPFRSSVFLEWKFLCAAFSLWLGNICVFVLDGELFLCDLPMNIKFPNILQFIYQTRVNFLIYQEFPINKWGSTHNRRKNGQKSMHVSQKS